MIIDPTPVNVLEKREHVFRRLVRRKSAVFGLVVLAVLVVCAFWPTGWLPGNPFEGNQSERLVPMAFLPGGSTKHLLGTDALGRDIFSVLIAGARYTLAVVFGAAVISVVIGVPLGLIAGYYRGAVDSVIMRLVDIQLAFPELVIVIAVVAAFGPNMLNLIVILGIIGWAPYARLIRGTVLSLRERGFVESARVMGIGNMRVMFSHVLPNSMSSVIIFLSSDLARLVLLESALAFLGLGVQPPTPSWGAMISEGRQYIYDAWWVSALPGVVIVLAVLAFNFLGDEIRDILDPRMAKPTIARKARNLLWRR